jgi:hypothetical protein
MKDVEYNSWSNYHSRNAYKWLVVSEDMSYSAARTTGPDELRDLFGDYIASHDNIDLNKVNWEEVYSVIICKYSK